MSVTLSAGYIVTLVGADYLSLLANTDSIPLFNTPSCCVAHALALFGNIFTKCWSLKCILLRVYLLFCYNCVKTKYYTQWLQILL